MQAAALRQLIFLIAFDRGAYLIVNWLKYLWIWRIIVIL